MNTFDWEQEAVNTIKCLGMDAVQKANSGHPGMVMGMADIATVLWHDVLKYDPKDPAWFDRDRVVVSNGHGSMLLYAMLHLSGTSLTLDDLKNFRQWHSPTAGHPEYGYAPGIETTTGPLGQGVANGVGMALAESHLRAKFGAELVNHHTYILCGDGCLMEGVASEAASLAGHLKLGKIVMLYDDNQITIDGGTQIAFTEDVALRFQAYGWHVLRVNGHDRQALREAIEEAKSDERPSLICCRTVIAHGSPNKAGTSKAHGSPLGDDEIRLTKEAMGMSADESFAVSQGVYDYFREKDEQRAQERADWFEVLENHSLSDQFIQSLAPVDMNDVEWPHFETGGKVATRAASGTVIQALAKAFPHLIGGSADLAGSNKTLMNGVGDFQASSPAGRNIHFGVREHGMASACNGMALHGGLIPYCATFLIFSSYMRPAVRLSALMHQQVIYVFTHDSFYLGEDGPTHQPIEQLLSLRAIPNLWVVRPADANETSSAWKMALLHQDGPTAICLTRQGLPILGQTEQNDDFLKGAYIISGCENPQAVLLATGSEVSLALEAQKTLKSEGVDVNVVSMPCCEVFDLQSEEYKSEILPPGVPRVSVEAGLTLGWERYLASAPKYASLGIDHYGASAPASVLAKEFGFTAENLTQIVKSIL